MKLRISLVVLSCFLSVLIGVWLSREGDKPVATGKGKVVIGVSMDTLKEARWQVDRDLFERRANELGADVLVQSANSDDGQQIKDVESLITRKVDALVIIPHNGAAMAKAVEMAHQAGIPVIAYDRLITGCDLDLYVTFEPVRVGEMQARYLVENLPQGKGKIVRIFGAKTDNNALLLKQGQDNVLKPSIDRGDIQIIHEDWADDWKPENAKKIMNAAITRGGQGKSFDCQAVLASNDGTAGGAIQALLEEGLVGKMLVTGQDADLVACQRIVQGTQSMSIYKPIKQLASRAAELAVKIASGKPIVANGALANGKTDVPSVLLDVVPVTRENMMETVIKDGFHPYEEVYRDAPDGQRPPKP
jgi:D-xylose transport system substrate-binding protein